MARLPPLTHNRNADTIELYKSAAKETVGKLYVSEGEVLAVRQGKHGTEVALSVRAAIEAEKKGFAPAVVTQPFIFLSPEPVDVLRGDARLGMPAPRMG